MNPFPDPLQRQLPVAKLRALVVDHHPDHRTEFSHHPFAEMIGHRRRLGEAKHRIDLGIGSVGVLATGPPRGHEMDLDLVFGDDPS